MNIPLSWLREYVDVPDDIDVLTEKMSMIGHMLDKTITTETDTVIDLELRGNRADCYAILGIAREVSACFNSTLRIPPLSHVLPVTTHKEVDVDVQSPVVKRFYSCVISHIAMKESPPWMQTRLRDYGIDPINAVVDVTNYVMIETGMPLHAFDVDALEGNVLILRNAKNGETLVTFDGGTIALTPDDVVFASEQSNPLGLVGIVGGENSGVQSNTKRILLECAGYDRATIRKTAFRHNVHTQAGLRHSHDLHSSLCDYALQRAASLIMECASTSETTIQGTNDYHPSPDTPKALVYDPHEVVRLGGVIINDDEQAHILERLGFATQPIRDSSHIEVRPPLFRTDITQQADIVEEVLRIWGYEHIPPKTLASEVPHPLSSPRIDLEERSRDILCAFGIDEVITVPFVHFDVIVNAQDPLRDRTIALLNPPTSDYTHMRTHLFFNQLDIVYTLLGRGMKDVALYEVGTVYRKKSTDYAQHPHAADFPYGEYQHMSIVATSLHGSWEYGDIKGVVESYLDGLQIRGVTYEKRIAYPFQVAATILYQDRMIGSVGLYNNAITQKVYDIASPVVGAILDLEMLGSIQPTPMSYLPYSLYPAIKIDMSVIIPRHVAAQNVLNAIRMYGGDLLRSVAVGDVYEPDEQSRSLLFHLSYQSKECMLEKEDVLSGFRRLCDRIEEEFGATIRD